MKKLITLITCAVLLLGCTQQKPAIELCTGLGVDCTPSMFDDDTIETAAEGMTANQTWVGVTVYQDDDSYEQARSAVRQRIQSKLECTNGSMLCRVVGRPGDRAVLLLLGADGKEIPKLSAAFVAL